MVEACNGVQDFEREVGEMGHLVCERVLDFEVGKEKALREIEAIALEEGDFDCAPFSEIRWLPERTYASREDARDAIRRLDRGDYDALAVPFRDVDATKDSATVKRARERCQAATEELNKAIADARPRNRAAAYVSCPECGSKVSTRHFAGDGDRCPVCRRGDLRSKTAVAKVERCRARKEEALGRLREAKANNGRRAPVKWLLKFEFHI